MKCHHLSEHVLRKLGYIQTILRLLDIYVPSTMSMQEVEKAYLNFRLHLVTPDMQGLFLDMS